MNASPSANERVAALLSFLNARTSQPFVAADIEPLLQEPRVADPFGRVVQLALSSNDCVLGVDELQTYEQLEDDLLGAKAVGLANVAEIRDEAEALEEEAKSLRKQISSMQQRFEILSKLAGPDKSPENNNQLLADVASVNDQVYQEALILVQAVGAFRSSISEPSNSAWSFADLKHVNEVFSSDDSLLDALDVVSKATLAPNEEDALSADVDLLASELADAQFRLFAAQVSQAYLTSLNQPPTPARNRSGANNATEIKSLQADLDTLVAQYEEATRVLARQRIMDRMSDTLVRGRIEKMEKELDAVQQLEDALEGMIGRMSLMRDLTLFEMSKFEALRQVTARSRQQLEHTQNKPESSPERSKKPEIPTEMVSLQNLVGVRDSDECRKLLAKANQLDQDLSQASRTVVNHALLETKNIVIPLMSALYEDSATSEIKFVNPEVISQIRNLEKHIEEVKGGISETASMDAIRSQSQQFVQKWTSHR